MSDFNISKQILEDSHEILLTVKVKPERAQKELRAMAKKLGRKVRIPGFRAGKAPINIIITRLGRDYIMEEVADKMAEEAYKAAIETAKDDITIGTRLNDVRLDPLTFEFIAPMKSKVTLGDYRGIRVPLQAVDEDEVAKDVANILDDLRQKHVVWRPVTDRPVQYGDLVTISLEMLVDGHAEVDEEEWEFIPDEDDYTITPEFDAQVVGMSIGESKAFTIEFPEDDEEWGGKTGVFEVEVKSIKAQELPELTDEFIAEHTDFDTVEEYKNSLADEARQRQETHNAIEFDIALRDELIKTSVIRYAPAALDREVELLEEEREELYKSYGFDSLDDLLSLQGRTREEFRESLKPEAKRDLENNMLFDAVAEAEQLDASDYELEQFIRAAGLTALQTEGLVERLKTDESYRAYIRVLLLRKKASDLLVAIAKGEEVPEPGQHPLEEAPAEPEADDEPEESESPVAPDEAETDAEPDEPEADGESDDDLAPEASAEADASDD